MPEPSLSSSTDRLDVPAPTDDAVTPSSEGELTATVVPDTIDEVELTPDGTAGPVAVLAAPPAKKKRKLGPFFWLATGWLLVLVLLAVFADVLPFVKDPQLVDRSALARQGSRVVAATPSPEHWFGGDSDGHDLFARVVYGARVSLIVGVAAIAIGLAVGGTLGLIAGYFRGRVD